MFLKQRPERKILMMLTVWITDSHLYQNYKNVTGVTVALNRLQNTPTIYRDEGAYQLFLYGPM